MPIYEYQCKECEHYLDALQKVRDEPLLTCPSCGKESLKRLVSAPRFRLKGKGWYETDFKTGNKRNLAGDHKDVPADKKKAAAEKSADKKPVTGKSSAGAAKSTVGKSSG